MLELLDYRGQIFEIYAQIRQEQNPRQLWERWCDHRHNLFQYHPVSALDDKQKAKFQALDYFDYEPHLRVTGRVNTAVQETRLRIDLDADGTIELIRFGVVEFELPEIDVETKIQTLNLYWIHGYGGGIFLPFKDATSGKETYGGGRYLYDTIKGADLGAYMHDNSMILDFNFAYNPSCSYNHRWVCPLSPKDNTLDFAINAGEKHPHLEI